MIGMARGGIIFAIVLIAISLFVLAAILPSALENVQNGTTSMQSNGGNPVPASTLAIYGLIGLIACVTIVMLFLKIGMGR